MFINISMLVVFMMMVASFVLLVKSGPGFSRISFLGLLSTLIVVEIILYAIYRQESMYLDVALVFALLGFMDVQFYAVYLRRKGDL